MDKIKKGLGRGLSSLIGETKIEVQKNQLSVSDLIPNKYQPRKIFDEANLEDLTNSIKERGMIQPIIVRKSNNENSKFEIIAGERRWLAAQRAGVHNVPVVITEVDDLKSLELAIVENVQRHDLNPLEEAQGYKRLIDEFSYDQEKVSKFIGKSRSYITNSLRILTLPDEVIKLIESNKLSTGHAKILVGLDNASFVANKIIEKKILSFQPTILLSHYSHDTNNDHRIIARSVEMASRPVNNFKINTFSSTDIIASFDNIRRRSNMISILTISIWSC